MLVRVVVVMVLMPLLLVLVLPLRVLLVCGRVCVCSVRRPMRRVVIELRVTGSLSRIRSVRLYQCRRGRGSKVNRRAVGGVMLVRVSVRVSVYVSVRV